MKREKRIVRLLPVSAVAVLAAAFFSFSIIADSESNNKDSEKKNDFIKWVEFQVSSEMLGKAYELDRDSYGTETHIDWVELLACTAARFGGEFSKEQKVLRYMDETAKGLLEGTPMEEYTQGLEYYDYFQEAYSAVLGGMVGEFEAETGEGIWEKVYGLKAFSPIAKGFPYSDYDDFGVSRSYGYQRNHLGHDLMGQIGTPIICVESGYVEALGWNQYGGWRIGIRSFDGKRYYYYAHLRQNYPYAEGLAEGSVVLAGDVIGYMGHTGYSAKENVNNIDTTHLHFGIQLIFDESQKEGTNEIWIDGYQIVKFLSRHRSEAVKVGDTREWVRRYGIKDPEAEAYQRKMK
ncbi:MAG: M23 family metallopeptidase [Lachnospiraceae bacterium]|nr:M23 family metallopeptidase [Oscillospiraceae bacterium]MDY5649209.1 M23 family metallopeptidase [Lachnospiraceae bacterium]